MLVQQSAPCAEKRLWQGRLMYAIRDIASTDVKCWHKRVSRRQARREADGDEASGDEVLPTDHAK